MIGNLLFLFVHNEPAFSSFLVLITKETVYSVFKGLSIWQLWPKAGFGCIMEKSIKRKTTDGLIWNTLQRFASKGIQFIFSILITRLLRPEDFGLIAIANVFIALSDVLIDSGFSKALIRNKDRTEKDYCSVFWFNITAALVLYAILFLCAPFIASYHQNVQLVGIIRIISISLIINAICGMQSLHLVVEMNFKGIAILETISMILGGAIAYSLALRGLGIWALVAQTLFGTGIRMVLFAIYVKWRPQLICSKDILKEYFGFSSKLLISDYVGRIYGALFTLTIGKAFSPSTLGLYGKAEAFSSTASGVISGPISSVSYPAITRLQDDNEGLIRHYYTMMGLTSYVVFPAMLGLMVIAQPLVPLLLTETWNDMIPLMQILCLSCIFSSMSSIPNNYMMVLGLSGIILRIQIITTIVGLVILFLFCRVSIVALCIGITAISCFSLFLQLYYLHKTMKYSGRFLLKTMLPSTLLSLVMALSVELIISIIPGLFWKVFVGILLGAFVYLGLSILFKNEHVKELISLIKAYL